MKNLQTLTLDSLEVAEILHKAHAHLLREINTYSGYLTESKIGLSEFWQESTYKDVTGRTLKCYLITKKGCEFIAHKITGKKGALFTATYINRFHEMEEALMHPKSAVPASSFRRVTWRGEVVMTSTHLASIMGLCPSTIKRTVVLNDVYRIIVTGDALKSFKRENHMLHYTAKSFTLYSRNSVNTLLTLYGMHDKLDTIINDYFPAIKEPPVRKIKLDSESIYRDIDMISKKLITINGLLNHLPVNSRTDERQLNIMQTVEEMWIETGSYITGLHRRIETL